jgi:hypothetical protein
LRYSKSLSIDVFSINIHQHAVSVTVDDPRGESRGAYRLLNVTRESALWKSSFQRYPSRATTIKFFALCWPATNPALSSVETLAPTAIIVSTNFGRDRNNPETHGLCLLIRRPAPHSIPPFLVAVFIVNKSRRPRLRRAFLFGFFEPQMFEE